MKIVTIKNGNIDFFSNYTTYSKSIIDKTLVKRSLTTKFKSYFDIKDVNKNNFRYKNREKLIDICIDIMLNKTFNPKYKSRYDIDFLKTIIDDLKYYIEHKEKKLKNKYKEDYLKHVIYVKINSNKEKIDLFSLVRKSCDKISKELLDFNSIPIKDILGLLESRKYLEVLLNEDKTTFLSNSISKSISKLKDFNFFDFRGQMVYGWGLEVINLIKLKEQSKILNIVSMNLAPTVLEQMEENHKKEQKYQETHKEEKIIFYPSVDLIGKTKENKDLHIEVKHYSMEQMRVFSLGKLINRLDNQITYTKRHNTELYYSLNFYKDNDMQELFIEVSDYKNFFLKISELLLENIKDNKFIRNTNSLDFNLKIGEVDICLSTNMINIDKINTMEELFEETNNKEGFSKIKIKFEDIKSLFQSFNSKFLDNDNSEKFEETYKVKIVNEKIIKDFRRN